MRKRKMMAMKIFVILMCLLGYCYAEQKSTLHVNATSGRKIPDTFFGAFFEVKFSSSFRFVNL